MPHAPYIELHCHSNFSLLDGADHPETLVAQAAELGMPALALTDHDNLYAAPRFAAAAEAEGVRPIFGAELTLETSQTLRVCQTLGILPGSHHLTLLVENEPGWANLCRLISRAQHNAAKGQAALPLEALAGHTAGLIALSGCRQGLIGAALLQQDEAAALAAAHHLRELFGPDHFFIELQHHLRPDDAELVAQLAALARRLGLATVATNNVHYARREGRARQDVLVCLRERVRLAQAGPLLRPNSEFYLKEARRLAPLFQDYPEAMAISLAIAERCRFALGYGLQSLPTFPTPAGLEAAAYLGQLCRAALPGRYPAGAARAEAQLAHELAVIDRAGLANYFLIVWDIVRFACERGIPCQGRGSAANSLVAYLLGISPIDPLTHDLVFERFLSAERQAAPDIDLDFCAERREEVIQYVYGRYGAEHAAMACTFVTFRRRSALAEVGRVLGEPSPQQPSPHPSGEETASRPRGRGGFSSPPLGPVLSEVEGGIEGGLLATVQFARQTKPPSNSPHWGEDASLPPDSGGSRGVSDLAQQILGFPRHLGLHNGGMILTGAPLSERLPTEPAAMENRVVVQWDKEGLEAAGLVKIDILGLRMLSAMAEAERIVEVQIPRVCQTLGVSPPENVISRPQAEKSPLRLDGHNQLGDFSARARRNDMPVSFSDPAVYELIATGSTIGIFQVESRAQAQLQPRLKPACFNDLIVAISLIRPGPIQGQMVHPYLRRRQGLEPVAYAHPLLIPALRETLGVILFQEQVLKVARDLAGFSPGQGELLRRALGSKQGPEALDRFRAEFVAGAQARGVAAATAETVFEQLRAFGGYAFAKSHAAAFAGLVYRSAWLKHYHPAAFYVGLLNHQPMGFWSPAVLVGDARRQGIETRPVDLARSQAQCTVEAGAIRLGFNSVDGFGQAASERLIAARQAGGPFRNLADLARRSRLPRRLIENLIAAGACDSWGQPRRQLLWQLGQLRYREAELDLIFPAEAVALPALTAAERLLLEQSVLGFSPGEQVMSLYRPRLTAQGILGSAALARQPHGRRVRVAGLVVVHQAPPTAKGVHFLTLEDEDGLIDLVVRPDVYAQQRQLWHTAPLLLVSGTVQRAGAGVSVLVGGGGGFLKFVHSPNEVEQGD